HRERFADWSARKAGELREARHLGVAIDRRQQGRNALRDDGAIVPVTHERTAEARVMDDREVRAELHARVVVDRFFDLAQSGLVANDLARDIAEAQLVEPRFANGGISDAALTLDEIAWFGPLAAIHRLERAATDEIPVVVAPLHELVLRQHPRAQLRGERGDDVRGQIPEGALPL